MSAAKPYFFKGWKYITLNLCTLKKGWKKYFFTLKDLVLFSFFEVIVLTVLH